MEELTTGSWPHKTELITDLKGERDAGRHFFQRRE
jgi:hypothetical protein